MKASLFLLIICSIFIACAVDNQHTNKEIPIELTDYEWRVPFKSTLDTSVEFTRLYERDETLLLFFQDSIGQFIKKYNKLGGSIIWETAIPETFHVWTNKELRPSNRSFYLNGNFGLTGNVDLSDGSFNDNTFDGMITDVISYEETDVISSDKAIYVLSREGTQNLALVNPTSTNLKSSHQLIQNELGDVFLLEYLGIIGPQIGKIYRNIYQVLSKGNINLKLLTQSEITKDVEYYDASLFTDFTSDSIILLTKRDKIIGYHIYSGSQTESSPSVFSRYGNNEYRIHEDIIAVKHSPNDIMILDRKTLSVISQHEIGQLYSMNRQEVGFIKQNLLEIGNFLRLFNYERGNWTNVFHTPTGSNEIGDFGGLHFQSHTMDQEYIYVSDEIYLYKIKKEDLLKN